MSGFFEIPIVRPGQKVSLLIAFLSLALYIRIGWFAEREQTATLLISYTFLFVFYLLLLNALLHYRALIGFAILFRLVFLFSIPNLSDDYFRFFWDGTLTHHNINPYLYLPVEIIENQSLNIPAIDGDLYEKLNSPEYYTVYPPVCQFVFRTAVWAGRGQLTEAVPVMKIFIFLAEAGTLFLMAMILNRLGIRRDRLLLYALNPLVVIELTGNVHFEAFMIFFVLLSVWLLMQRRIIMAAGAFALAISSKLLPVLLLPFFLKRLGWKKSMVFYLFSLLFTVLTFLPFASSELINGLSSSIGLYFRKFEFNASVFYLVRSAGYWIKGYDVIQTAGPLLGALAVIMILIVFFKDDGRRENLPGIFIWPLFIYLALASIVHPWYVTPLIAFAVFTNYRFPMVWSFLIFFSYAGYTAEGFYEHTGIVTAEYLTVFLVLIYELRKYATGRHETGNSAGQRK